MTKLNTLRKVSAVALSFAMALSTLVVAPSTEAAKKVVLAKKKITISVGKTMTVNIKNVKKNQVKKITVKSKKVAVATAKAKGKIALKVTGKKAGATKATVELKLKKKISGKKKYKLTLKVTVKAVENKTTSPQPTATPETPQSNPSSSPAPKEVISKRNGFSIREISDDLFDRMKAGNTYKDDCVVPREDLRYIMALHKDKDGNTHQGEMVVHKLIAEDVLDILEKLYDANYPIERMVLPDNYMADDEIMMRDNNSSCFNFRFISHTTRISKHGLGMAVDINTLYNPYYKIVTNTDGSQEEVIEPATGKPYLDRTQDFDYKINKGDLCYKLFIEKGFEWGGDWTDRKDYQHFELPSSITEKYSEEYSKAK